VSAGYVYVLGFSNGSVKVGRSKNGQQRLGDHKSTARKFGLTVTDEWLSPAHVEWERNEEALKAIAADLGGIVAGREYFSGIEFAAVRDKAMTLPFTAPEAPPEPAAVRPQVPRPPDAGTVAFGNWFTAPEVLASPSGRARLRKICTLLDILGIPADVVMIAERQFTVNECVAREFAALLAEISAEGTRFAQAVAETRAFRAEWEKEQAAKAAA
jgi:hypothetical protein